MKLEDLNISNLKGVTQDSRTVKLGYLFAALPGVHVDGADYIDQAIQNGADYILCSEAGYQNCIPCESRDPEGLGKDPRLRGGSISGREITFITTSTPRAVFADIVSQFYREQPKHIVAVTGTNGKSSVVEFVRQLWSLLGLNGAAMGTLGLQSENLTIEGNMTTPEVVKLHETLNKAHSSGVTHLAMEASSHGLDQYRMHEVGLEAAAFTNLSHDHLDYHGTMENYLKAKAKLFSEVLLEGKIAVLNADIDQYESLQKICTRRDIKILDYGCNAEALKIVNIRPKTDGQIVSCETFGEHFEFKTPLVGEFQIYNMLCAAGLVIACGAEPKDVRPLLPKLKGVRGRLEAVPGHQSGAGIYVDYAHTPDALEKVLKALRAHTQGRLICLFGCGGDRDKTKRPEMGSVSKELADLTIVTDDNPRSEDPALIRKDILKAIPDAIEIDGRAAAINHAVQTLEAGDVLVVAGKGHEQGQVFADHTEPFDDRTHILDALNSLKSSKK